MTGRPTKSEHWSSEHLKKKGVRIPLIILLYCSVAFLLFLFGKAIFGYHVKIFGIEVNQPVLKADTLYEKTHPDTIFLADTQSKEKSQQHFYKTNAEKHPGVNKKNFDTIKEQKTSVTGDNAHIISGNNNQVEVNGDVSVSQQPELNDWYKQFFIRHIDQVKRDSSITSNKILIFVGVGSNAGKLADELRSFLKDKGYDVSMASTLEPFKGIGVDAGIYVDNKTKTVDIYLGNISQ